MARARRGGGPVAALSLATDIGMGQPLEHGLGVGVLAVGLGDEAGLDEEELARAWYAALLRHVGFSCPGPVARNLLGTSCIGGAGEGGCAGGSSEELRMLQELRPAMSPELALRPSPELVASMTMLSLSSAELEDLVEGELAENPALERIEAPRRDYGEGWDGLVPRARGEASEALTAVADQPGAAQLLLRELTPELRDADHPIAECLVASMGPRGFLETTCSELADELGVPLSRVEGVLQRLREVAPPGAGARDVRECLLLQLDALPETGPQRALARRIVSDHLAELARGSLGTIARETGSSREEIAAARAFILARLRPYAALDDASAGPAAIPDVAIRRRQGTAPEQFAVEVLESVRLPLRVDPLFASLARDGAAGLSASERRCVHRQIGAARALLDRVQRRWETLRRVTECIVACERDFLIHGTTGLRPLTRAEVARRLELHESTVGRATADKYALLPTGAVFPLRSFFIAARAPQEVLRLLVASEPEPLCDAELARRLGERGFSLSRRTVAKYRGELGIAAHSAR